MPDIRVVHLYETIVLFVRKRGFFMKNQSVLISGASIAGPALAYWLSRYGFQPTIVEHAPTVVRAATRSIFVEPPFACSNAWDCWRK